MHTGEDLIFKPARYQSKQPCDKIHIGGKLLLIMCMCMLRGNLIFSAVIHAGAKLVKTILCDKIHTAETFADNEYVHAGERNLC